jgi:hypothetical protein
MNTPKPPTDRESVRLRINELRETIENRPMSMGHWDVRCVPPEYRTSLFTVSDETKEKLKKRNE